LFVYLFIALDIHVKFGRCSPVQCSVYSKLQEVKSLVSFYHFSVIFTLQNLVVRIDNQCIWLGKLTAIFIFIW